MSILEVIGWLGSGILVWSLMQTQILRLRVFNLVGCFIHIGYNAVVGVWPMVGLNIALAIINIYNLVRLRTAPGATSAYEAVEVGPDDGYLRFLLERHGADIAEFNPGFDLASHSDGRAFLILSSGETAGVVLLHDAGDGLAQLDLDYVSERFRNLHPGTFLFHDSGLLAAHGFDRVATPAGALATYYEKIGFSKTAAGYELALSRLV